MGVKRYSETIGPSSRPSPPKTPKSETPKPEVREVVREVKVSEPFKERRNPPPQVKVVEVEKPVVVEKEVVKVVEKEVVVTKDVVQFVHVEAPPKKVDVLLALHDTLASLRLPWYLRWLPIKLLITRLVIDIKEASAR